MPHDRTIRRFRLRETAGVVFLITALAFGCGHPDELSGTTLSGYIRELRADGRLIVTSSGRDFAILLSDYRLPREGEPRFEPLRKALAVTRSAPLSCEVERQQAGDIYAVCAIEGRTKLSDVFMQWGIPDTNAK
jgi:hypothetical protein